MAAILDEHQSWQDVGGKPLTDGELYIGIAGSDPVANPKPIFSDSTLSTPAANPQTLDALGKTTVKIYTDGEYSYQVNDVHGTQIDQGLEAGTTADNVLIIGLTNVSGGDTIVASGGITAYVDKAIYSLTVAQVNTGPVTLNIDSVGAVSVFKNFDKELDGGDWQEDQNVNVQYNGTSDTLHWIDQTVNLLESGGTMTGQINLRDGSIASGQMGDLLNAALDVSVSGNDITIALKNKAGDDPSATDTVVAAFRDVTLTSSLPVYRSITAALSMTVSAGSTLGFANDEDGRIYVGLIDNAGTVELCVWRSLLEGLGLYKPSESALQSTTAEGGAGGADDPGVLYSTTARTDVPIRILGYFDIKTGATAGNWSADPTLVQVVGPGVPVTGEIIQTARIDDGADASGATLLPIDDTIPQNTEGDEYLSQSVIASNTLNIAHVSVSAQLGSSANTQVSLAVFDSQSSDAVGAITSSILVNQEYQFSLNVRKVFGTLSPVTFSARAGGSSAGTTYFNSNAGSAIFGGVCNSFIEINEIFV